MQVATTIDGDSGMVVKRLSVPMGLEELMESLTKQVLLKKPKDLFAFASEHFAHLVAIREKLDDSSPQESPSTTEDLSARRKPLKVKSITSETKFNKLPTPIIFTNSKTRTIATPKVFQTGVKPTKSRFIQQEVFSRTSRSTSTNNVSDIAKEPSRKLSKERAKWKKQDEVRPIVKKTPREIRQEYSQRIARERLNGSKDRSKDKDKSRDRSTSDKDKDMKSKENKTDRDRSKPRGKSEASVREVSKESKKSKDTPRTGRDQTQKSLGSKVTPRTKSTDSNSSSMSIHGKTMMKSNEKNEKREKSVGKVAPLAVSVAAGATSVGAAALRKSKKKRKDSNGSNKDSDDSDLKESSRRSGTLSEGGESSDRSDKSSKSSKSAKSQDSEKSGSKETIEEEADETVSGDVVDIVAGRTEDMEPEDSMATTISESMVSHTDAVDSKNADKEMETVEEKDGTPKKEEDDEEEMLETIPEDTTEVKIDSEKPADKENNNDDAIVKASQVQMQEIDKTDKNSSGINSSNAQSGEIDSTQTDIKADIALLEKVISTASKETTENHQTSDKIPEELALKDVTTDSEKTSDKHANDVLVDSDKLDSSTTETSEEAQPNVADETGKDLLINADKHKEQIKKDLLSKEVPETEHQETTPNLPDDDAITIDGKPMTVPDEEEPCTVVDAEEVANINSGHNNHAAKIVESQLEELKALEDDQQLPEHKDIEHSNTDAETSEIFGTLHATLSAPELGATTPDLDTPTDSKLVAIGKTPSTESLLKDQEIAQSSPLAQVKVDDDGPLSLEDISKYLNETKDFSTVQEKILSEDTRPTTSVVFGGDVQPQETVTESLAQNVASSDDGLSSVIRSVASAATRIQSVWRGHQTRKHFNQILREKGDKAEDLILGENNGNDVESEESFDSDKIVKAATVIQAFMKGNLVRKHLKTGKFVKNSKGLPKIDNKDDTSLATVGEENEEKFHKAALLIQAFVRGHMVRKRSKILAQKIDIADNIKDTDHSFFDTKANDENQKNFKAATIIQAAMKGFLVRKQIKTKMTSASSYQNHQNNLQLVNDNTEKVFKAATLIQAAMKGFLVRKHNKTNMAAENTEDMKVSLVEDNNNAEKTFKAAALIQAAVRGFLIRKKNKTAVLDASKAQVIVPKHEDNDDNAEKFFKAATVLQAAMRGFLVRRKYYTAVLPTETTTGPTPTTTEKDKEKIDKAATTIQSAMKGYLVRKQNKMAAVSTPAPDTNIHNESVTDEEKFYKAATVIQAAMKGFLVRKTRKMADTPAKNEINVEPEDMDFFKAATVIQAAMRGFLVRRRNQLNASDTDSELVHKDGAAKDEDVYNKLTDSIDQEIHEVLQKLEGVLVPEEDINSDNGEEGGKRKKRSIDFDPDEAARIVASLGEPEIPKMDFTEEEELDTDKNNIAMTKNFVNYEKEHYVPSPSPIKEVDEEEDDESDGKVKLDDKQKGDREEDKKVIQEEENMVMIQSEHVKNDKEIEENVPDSEESKLTNKSNDHSLSLSSGTSEQIKPDFVDGEKKNDIPSLKVNKLKELEETIKVINTVEDQIEVDKDEEKKSEEKDSNQKHILMTRSFVDYEKENYVPSPLPNRDAELTKIEFQDIPGVPKLKKFSSMDKSNSEDINNSVYKSEPESKSIELDHLSLTKSFVDYEKENYITSLLPNINSESEKDNKIDQAAVLELSDVNNGQKNDGKIIVGAIGAVGGFIATQTNNLKSLLSSGSNSLEEAKESLNKKEQLVESLDGSPVSKRFAKLKMNSDNVPQNDIKSEEMMEDSNQTPKNQNKVMINNLDNVSDINAGDITEEAVSVQSDNTFSDFKNVIKEGHKDMVDNVSGMFSNLNKKVSGMLKTTEDNKKNIFEVITKDDEDITDNLNDIQKKFNSDVTNIQETVDDIKSASDIVNVMSDTQNDITDNINDKSDNTINNIKIGIKEDHYDIGDNVSGILSNQNQKVSEIFKTGDVSEKNISEVIEKNEEDITNNIYGTEKIVNSEVNDIQETLHKTAENTNNLNDKSAQNEISDIEKESVLRSDNIIGGIKNVIKEGHQDISENISGVFFNLNQKVLDVVKTSEDTEKHISEVIKKKEDDLKNNLNDIEEKINSEVNNIQKSFQITVEDSKSELIDTKNKLDKIISEGSHKDIQENVDIVEAEVTDIKEDVQGAASKSDNTFSDIKNVIKESHQDISDNISSILSNLNEKVSGDYKTSEDTEKEIGKDKDDLRNDVKDIEEKVNSDVHDNQKLLQNTVDNAKSELNDTTNKIDQVMTASENVIEDNDIKDKVNVNDFQSDNQDISGNISGILSNLNQQVSEVFKTDGATENNISDVIEGREENIKNNVYDIEKKVNSEVNDIQETVDDIFVSTQQEVSETKKDIHDATSNSDNTLSNIKNVIKQGHQDISDNISGMFSNLNKKVSGVFKTGQDNEKDIPEIIKKGEKNIADNLINIQEKITTEGNNIQESVKKTIDDTKSELNDTSNEVGNAIIETQNYITDNIYDTSTNAPKKINNIKDNVDGTKSQADNTFSDIQNVIKESHQDISGNTTGILSNLNQNDSGIFKIEKDTEVDISEKNKTADDIKKHKENNKDELNQLNKTSSNNFETVNDTEKNISEMIEKEEDNHRDNLKDIVDKTVNDSISELNDTASEFNKKISATQNDIKDNIDDISVSTHTEVNDIKEDIHETALKSNNTFTDFKNVIKEGHQDISDNISGMFSNLNQKVSGIFKNSDDTKTDNSDIITKNEEDSNIKNIIDDTAKVKKIVSDTITQTHQDLQNNSHNLEQEYHNTSVNVENVTSDIKKVITKDLNDIEENIKNLSNNVTNEIDDIKKDAHDTKSDNAISDIKSVIKEGHQDISDNISGMFSNLNQKVSGIFKTDNNTDVDNLEEHRNTEDIKEHKKDIKDELKPEAEGNQQVIDDLQSEAKKTTSASNKQVTSEGQNDTEDQSKSENAFSDIKNAIKAGHKDISDNIGGIFTNIFNKSEDSTKKMSDDTNQDEEETNKIDHNTEQVDGTQANSQNLELNEISEDIKPIAEKHSTPTTNKMSSNSAHQVKIQSEDNSIKEEVKESTDSLELIRPSAPLLQDIVGHSIEEEEPPAELSEAIVNDDNSHVDILIIDDDYTSPLEDDLDLDDVDPDDDMDSQQLIDQIKEDLNNIKTIIEDDEEAYNQKEELTENSVSDDSKRDVRDHNEGDEDMSTTVMITEVTNDIAPKGNSENTNVQYGVELQESVDDDVNKMTEDGDNNSDKGVVITEITDADEEDSKSSLENTSKASKVPEQVVKESLDVDKIEDRVGRLISNDSSTSLDSLATVVLTEDLNKFREQTVKDKSLESTDLKIKSSETTVIPESDIPESNNNNLDKNANQDDLLLIDATKLDNTDIKFLTGLVSAATKIQSMYRGFRVRSKNKENELNHKNLEIQRSFEQLEQTDEIPKISIANDDKQQSQSPGKNPTLGNFLRNLTNSSKPGSPPKNKLNADESEGIDEEHGKQTPFYLHDPHSPVKGNPIANVINLTSKKTKKEAHVGLLHSGEFHDSVIIETPKIGDKVQDNDTKMADERRRSNDDAKTTPGAERPVTTQSADDASPTSVVTSVVDNAHASINKSSDAFQTRSVASSPAPSTREFVTQHNTETARDINREKKSASSTGSTAKEQKEKEAEEEFKTLRINTSAGSIFGVGTEVEKDMDAKRNNATIKEKNTESQAATKIQASFRGYQVRKQMQKPTKNGNDIIPPKRSARRKTSGGRAPESKKLKDDGDIEDKSATKIQAGIRGFLVRRRNQKKKDNEEV